MGGSAISMVMEKANPRGKVILKPGRDSSLRRRHPWIFSGAIERIDGPADEGALVEVASHSGEVLGVGHYAGRDIAVKLIAFAAIDSFVELVCERLRAAVALRKELGLWDDSATTGFRVINAEGDGLAGLILDLYGEVMVIQAQSPGMKRSRGDIVDAVRRELGDRVKAIVDKSVEEEGGSAEGRWIWGEPRECLFREHGLVYRVDPIRGQKTGFFLDQRDNRQIVGGLSARRRVLNLFAYTGGFSLAALRGNATMVVSVDSAAKALEQLPAQVALNTLTGAHQEVVADCFEYLKNESTVFDVVVVDPPAMAKHKKALPRALQGYEQLNALALSRVAASGWLATFSCSQHVSAADFDDALRRAARRAGREIRVIKELGAAACHPVNLFHREGSYLKGRLLFVA